MPAFVVGRNEDGQAGIGTSADISSPALVSSLSNVMLRSLASGSGHALFLTEEGDVYAAGRGDDGRLGIAPSMTNASIGWVQTPTRVLLRHEGESEVDAKRRKAVYVAAGSYHTMIVDMDGNLWASGGCLYGKLGIGEGISSPVPRQIRAFGTRRVIQVACGSRHTIALIAEPGVFPSFQSRQSLLSDVDAGGADSETTERQGTSSSSRDQFVVVRRGGVGNPSTGDSSRSLTQREGTQDSNEGLDGSYSTASSSATDAAYQWYPDSKSGSRSGGATDDLEEASGSRMESGRGRGRGSTRPSPLATLAAVLNMSVSSMMGSPTSPSSSRNVSGGGAPGTPTGSGKDVGGQARRVRTPLAGTASSTAGGSGSASGNLTQASSTRSLPARLASTTSFESTSGGGSGANVQLQQSQAQSGRSSQMAAPSTSLWAWGSCDKGVLGLGDESMLHRYPIVPTAGGSFCLPEPQKLPPFTAPPGSTSGSRGTSQSASVGESANAPVEIVQVSACGFHNLALDYQGRVYSWGEGRFGRLGTGFERDVWVPTAITQHLIPECVTHVAAGGFHSICVTEDGSVYVFGGNEHGQCGTGSTTNMLLPVRLTTLSDKIIVAAAAGWSHSLFLTNDGTVYSTGNSEHGKLGYTPTRGQLGVGPPAAGSGLCQLLPRKIDALTGQTVTYVSSYNETSFFLTAPCGTHTYSGALSVSHGIAPLFSVWNRRDAEQWRLRAKDLVASQAGTTGTETELARIPPSFHSQWRAHMEYYKSARDSGRYYTSPTAPAMSSTPRMATTGPLTPLSLPSPMMSPSVGVAGGQTPLASSSAGAGYMSPLPPAALPSQRQAGVLQRETSLRSIPALGRLTTSLPDQQVQQSPRAGGTTPLSIGATAPVLQGISARTSDQKTPTLAGATAPPELDTTGLGTPRAGGMYYEYIPHPSGQGGILSPYLPPQAAPVSVSAFPGTPIRGAAIGEPLTVQTGGPSTPMAPSTPTLGPTGLVISTPPPIQGLTAPSFFASPSLQPASRVSTPMSTTGVSYRGTPTATQMQSKQQLARSYFPSKSIGFSSLPLDLSVLVDHIHYFPDIVLTFPGDEPESLTDYVMAHRQGSAPNAMDAPTQKSAEGTRSTPFSSQLDYTAQIPGSNYFQEPEIPMPEDKFFVEPFLVAHRGILCVRCPPLAAMIFSSSEATQKRRQTARGRRRMKRMKLQRMHTNLKKKLQVMSGSEQSQGQGKQTSAGDEMERYASEAAAGTAAGAGTAQGRGSRVDLSAVRAARQEDQPQSGTLGAGIGQPLTEGAGTTPSSGQGSRRHFFQETAPDMPSASSSSEPQPSGGGANLAPINVGMTTGTTTDADSELRAQSGQVASPFQFPSPSLYHTPRESRNEAVFASEEVDADDLFSDAYFDKLEEEEKLYQMQQATPEVNALSEAGTGTAQVPAQMRESKVFTFPSGTSATEGVDSTMESGYSEETEGAWKRQMPLEGEDFHGRGSSMASEDDSESELWAALDEDEDVQENPIYRDLLTVLNLPQDTTVLQLPDTRKDTFRIFLYFLYTDSLPPELLNLPSHIWNFAAQEQKASEGQSHQERSEDQGGESYLAREEDESEPRDFIIPLEIALLIDVSALAERFVCDKLAILCEQFIMKHIQANTAPLLLTAADSMSATRLRRRIIYYIADNERFDTISSSKTFVDVLDRSLILEVLNVRSDQYARMKAATPTHAELI